MLEYLSKILKKLSWSLWVQGNNIWIKNTPTIFLGFNESSIITINLFLVFFDDILIYNSTLNIHINHLREILKVLRKNQLYAKRSKCFYCENQIKYLDHIISAKCVTINPKKIEATKDWPKRISRLAGILHEVY